MSKQYPLTVFSESPSSGPGHRERPWATAAAVPTRTPRLPTNIVDFGGVDSSVILILRGGIPRPIGDFPESLTQAMLVGVMLVGGLGVLVATRKVSGPRPRGDMHPGPGGVLENMGHLETSSCLSPERSS